MTVAYARTSDGSDATDGLTWANAKLTTQAALTVSGAGGRTWLSQAHAESTGSSLTLTSPGTAGAYTELICGNDGAEPPTALAATATISTTGAASIALAGFGYISGVKLNAGSGVSASTIFFNSATPWGFVLDNCLLRIQGSGSAGLIQVGAGVGSDDVHLTLTGGSNVQFAGAAQNISLRSCRFRWYGGALIAGSAPTILFKPAAGINTGVSALIVGVDLSIMGSGCSLVDVSLGATGLIEFLDCKLGSSVGYVTGTRPSSGGVNVRIQNCHAGDVNYFFFFDCYEGSITSETVIVRTGGASDGVTPVSYKMVTSANAKYYLPLTSEWTDSVEIWNDAIDSSLTATLYIVNDGTTYTDGDIAIEVEHLGTSGFPLGSFISDKMANIIATPVNQTTSTETWTTTGLTTPVKQELSIAFTPREKGVVRARILFMKPSATAYFCSKLLLA